MSNDTQAQAGGEQQGTWNQGVGALIFVVCCGFTAMELTGFGFGLGFELTLTVALLIATIGGAVGGAFICPRPMAAGVIGGLIAGPIGLLAVYYYTLPRESVYNVELVLVQGVASLPGVLIGFLVKWFISGAGACDDAEGDA